MILARKVEADHGTPGLDWEPVGDGAGIKARLYPTIKARLKGWRWPLSLSVLWGLMQVNTESATVMADLFAASFTAGLLIVPAFLLWPYWPFSKSIKMDADYLTVGTSRYDLREVSGFSTRKHKYGLGKFDEIVTFGYGRKTIKLKVPNPPEHAFRIAEFLNWARKGLIERGTLASEQDTPQPKEDRAAAF